jgi:hypothetical protein
MRSYGIEDASDFNFIPAVSCDTALLLCRGRHKVRGLSSLLRHMRKQRRVWLRECCRRLSAASDPGLGFQLKHETETLRPRHPTATTLSLPWALRCRMGHEYFDIYHCSSVKVEEVVEPTFCPVYVPQQSTVAMVALRETG